MNKTSGGDGIPAELFQVLKYDAVKVLHSIWQQIWKTQQWPQDWKRLVFIPVQRKAMPNNAQTTAIVLISHASKVTSLLFNMLFSFVIAFLPRSEHLLISWLQSPSAVILETEKIKSLTASIICWNCTMQAPFQT